MSPLPGSGGVPAYAATKLIAYLGNKRALLPRIAALFSGLGPFPPGAAFLDPFAGSGAVSRLARSMGFRVMANDLEEYAEAVNRCWLGVSADEAPGLFAAEGGLPAVLAGLDRLHPLRGGDGRAPAVEPYVARHYAPASTREADWRRERLFYTAENAAFLDRARCAIESLRPAGSTGPAALERDLLLGPLVYEAATHANTSGLFKACHKGFGGHGGDALGRILAPMSLEPPLLWPGPGAEVGRGEAADFCASRPAELCYLDPPYNGHQYGSNYHLLNTLTRWDRPPVSEERLPDGSLAEKAGIPRSWVRSRSDFCSRRAAPAAFARLLASVDARVVVLSYNDEGLVPAGELLELLSDRAEVRVVAEDYASYRGGRQSALRSSRSRELLFVAERRGAGGRRPASTVAARAELGAALALAKALRSPLDPEKALALPPAPVPRGLSRGGSSLVFSSRGETVELPCWRFLLVEPGADAAVQGLSTAGKEELAVGLEGLSAGDQAGACRAALALLRAGVDESRLRDFALASLRRLAHPRYVEVFRALLAEAESVAALPGEGGRGREVLAARLAALRGQAEARLAGAPVARPAPRNAVR